MRKFMKTRTALGIAAISAVAALVGAGGSASITSAVGSPTDVLTMRWSAPITVPYAGPINRQAYAHCNSGEKVTGGGASITGIGTRRGEYFSSLVRSAPTPEGQTGVAPNGWYAEATNNSARLSSQGGEDSVLRAYVVCLS